MNNLFKQFGQLLQENAQAVLVIQKTATGLSVSVTIRNSDVKDEAAKAIPPFVVSGSPEELDESFMDAVLEPMQEVAGIHTSMRQFEEAKKAAMEKSAEALSKKKADADEKKAKKAKYDKLVEEAQKAVEEKNWKKAAELFDKAAEGADEPEKAKATKKAEECRQKDVPSIFDEAGEPEEEATETDSAQE